MILYRLVLSPFSPEAKRDAKSPYELHRTLFRCFQPENEEGQSESGEKNRMLFRVEPKLPIDQTPGTVVLVQSSHRPARWGRLPPNYGHLEGPKEVPTGFTADQLLSFRLNANTVAKWTTSGDRSPTGKEIQRRRGLRTEEEQRAWLMSRAAGLGFEPLYFTTYSFRVGRRSGTITDGDKTSIPHFGARFEGLIRVIDPERFTETLRDGVGPAKAFGFGLMSVAPPR